MADEVNFSEILISPAAKLVREISQSVAEAQRDLDSAALESQAKLASTHPDLANAGYLVPWYQIPEVQVELKMAVHYERKTSGSPVRVWLTPYNAKYGSTQNFSAEGTSTLKLKIMPVPPIVAEIPK